MDIIDSFHTKATSLADSLCRWGTLCAGAALLSTTLASGNFSASPVHAEEAAVPVRALPTGRVAAPYPESVPEEAAPWSGVSPLNFSPSTFGRGKVSAADSRMQTPEIVRSVPVPYFDVTAPAGSPTTPLITLTDFLEATPPAEKSFTPSLLPPEPIMDVAQLEAPRDTKDVNTPGLEDDIFRPVSQIQPYYDYSPTGKYPGEYKCRLPSSMPDQERARCPEIQELPAQGTIQRQFALVDYCWYPTNLRHKPLYFQDVSLERYGHKFPHGMQPFVSLAKFGVQGIGLPYQLALTPPWQDVYSLGYYRPGDNAPELIYQVPFNLSAAAAAGGIYTGLIFLFP